MKGMKVFTMRGVQQGSQEEKEKRKPMEALL